MKTDSTVKVVVFGGTMQQGEDYKRATHQPSARVIYDAKCLFGAQNIELHLVGTFYQHRNYPELRDEAERRRMRGDIVRIITVDDWRSDWEHLMRFGYAPGAYMSRCTCCGRVKMDLDKRAHTCRPCAELKHDDEVWHDQ